MREMSIKEYVLGFLLIPVPVVILAAYAFDWLIDVPWWAELPIGLVIGLSVARAYDKLYDRFRVVAAPRPTHDDI
jgi:hypothetical protein